MSSAAQKEPELAVLFGLPHDGEIPMHNDVAAMYDALRARGLGPEQIICLEGQFDRQMMQRLLYVSGHGYASLDSRQATRVDINLSADEQTPDEG